MGYLLWAILNFSIAGLLLYLIYRLTKLVYARFGLLGAILAVVIIFSIATPASHHDRDKTQTWDFKTPSDVRYFQQGYAITLTKNAVFDIVLHMISLSDKDRQKEQPLKAFSTISGLVGYNDWTPERISISTKPRDFNYTVAGRIDWKLLNFTVYTERKTYVGTVKKS